MFTSGCILFKEICSVNWKYKYVGKSRSIERYFFLIKGLDLLNDGSLVKEFVKSKDIDVPVQMIVLDHQKDGRFEERKPPSIMEEYPLNSTIFFLSHKLYGVMGTAIGYDIKNDTLDIRVEVFWI
jgi:5'-3' exonuclease